MTAAALGDRFAGRALQGVGAALVMPLGLALLSAAFPPERRDAAIGIFSAITGLAVASGPLVGGAVVEGIDWTWIFWLNVPIGLLVVPLVLARMDESHGARSPLDLRGLALVSAGALALVWGLVRGNPAGWASLEVVVDRDRGARPHKPAELDGVDVGDADTAHAALCGAPVRVWSSAHSSAESATSSQPSCAGSRCGPSNSLTSVSVCSDL